MTRKSLWVLLLFMLLTVCACGPADQTVQPVTAIPAAFDQIPAMATRPLPGYNKE